MPLRSDPDKFSVGAELHIEAYLLKIQEPQNELFPMFVISKILFQVKLVNDKIDDHLIENVINITRTRSIVVSASLSSSLKFETGEKFGQMNQTACGVKSFQIHSQKLVLNS